MLFNTDCLRFLLILMHLSPRLGQQWRKSACSWGEKNLDDYPIAQIVEMATFKNMKQDPKANYELIPQDLLLKLQFMHKGQCSKITIVECVDKLYPSLTLLYLFCGCWYCWRLEEHIHCGTKGDV